MSVLHNAYDTDPEHIADVLEAIAHDIRDENAYIHMAADAYTVEVDEHTKCGMELELSFTHDSDFPYKFVNNNY